MDEKILTYDTLWCLVDIDETEHKIKKLASIFLEAMTDWPTTNQTKIEEYIFEFKKSFGSTISINGISKKGPVINDGWKLESGASIQELIRQSENYFNESNFDQIIDKIISYYNEEFKKVDFIAELQYLTTKQGGRKTPANSGYRPQLKFDFTEMQTSGQQTFIDKEFVNPGEKVKAKIKISYLEFYTGRLNEGMEFEFREGETIIGTGKIKYIVNERLEKASW